MENVQPFAREFDTQLTVSLGRRRELLSSGESALRVHQALKSGGWRGAVPPPLTPPNGNGTSWALDATCG